MAASRLGDHLNSNYFEAANKMTSKKARRRIIAYVESYDDVIFWHSVLSGFEDENRYFEVMLPTRGGKMGRGKKAALMALLDKQVGQDMIACVDADYDYLMQGTTHNSQAILNNPYIFHTYAYSIENMQSYAPSLHDVCVSITLTDQSLFDFNAFILRYSEIIYPLFVWNIWHYLYAGNNEFTITDFNKIIETGRFDMKKATIILQNLESKVNRKVQQLRTHHRNSLETYERLKTHLTQLGVTPPTTYLYIQGHHLFDTLIMPMLSDVCNRLIKLRESEIYRQALHHTQLRNELSSYEHSIAEILPILKRNRGYMLCPLFQKIRADIERYLNREQKPVETMRRQRENSKADRMAE
ncbi:MAG: DUF4435 domain-containing protein [Prevotellaceae bacterium]|nr:DUF4435 domain-containing protein [Prevotellaceae bacterium]MDY3365069.1 DUF4435 domain-containing protein [Prevotella sp.]